MANPPTPPGPIETKVRLGAALRCLRERRALTQEELGSLLHMDYRYIRRIEKGERGVSWYTIVRFLHALEATVHDLADALAEPPEQTSPHPT